MCYSSESYPRSDHAVERHVPTVHGERRRYWRPLTLALSMLCAISTSVHAAPSSLFGPRQNPPRAAAPHLTANEARQIAATLSDCEAVAVELDATRREARVLREALTLTRQAAAAYEAAARAQAQRADNEAQRALNADLLRAGAEAELKRERRAGRWRAIRWAAIGIGVGVVVGLVAGE